MNTLTIKGDWNVAKGKIKQRWARLTDDDLKFVEGQEDELIGRIQKRTGETRENVERFISEACDCPPERRATAPERSAVHYPPRD